MRKNQIKIGRSGDLDVLIGELLSIEGEGTTAKASVQIDGGNPYAGDSPDVPMDFVRFYYHCTPDNTDDGPVAFTVGDKVILAKDGSQYFIVGFEDQRPRSCTPPRFFVKVLNYLFEKSC